MENLELYKKICREFGKEDHIGLIDYVEVNGIKYTCFKAEELETIDEGKYQYGGEIYNVGILKGKFDIEETLFYMEQDFTQTGSYYSYQKKEYEKPYVVEKKEVVRTIWEAID